MTREQWLTDATDIMRPWYVDLDKPIPERVRVSVGGGPGRTAIGWCYGSHAASDAVNQIYISPKLDDPIKVLSTLVHELVHAADDGQSGHRGEFARVARGLGLEGKMTATHAGEELTGKLTTIADKLGEYPHSALDLSVIKKQSTRMLKLYAPCCGYIARTTRKWIEHGVPACPCGNDMQVDG